jgi:hypothetical protein
VLTALLAGCTSQDEAITAFEDFKTGIQHHSDSCSLLNSLEIAYSATDRAAYIDGITKLLISRKEMLPTYLDQIIKNDSKNMELRKEILAIKKRAEVNLKNRNYTFDIGIWDLGNKICVGRETSFTPILKPSSPPSPSLAGKESAPSPIASTMEQGFPKTGVDVSRLPPGHEGTVAFDNGILVTKDFIQTSALTRQIFDMVGGFQGSCKYILDTLEISYGGSSTNQQYADFMLGCLKVLKAWH